MLAALMLLSGPAHANDGATIDIHIEGLRNTQGIVRLCLTRNQAHFPDCNGDPAAIKRSIPTARAAHVRIEGAAPGTYALAVIHDENSNGRLDRFMAIPREGFGFSRNPRIRMGPPRFDEVRFDVAGGTVRQTVRLRYLI